MFKKSFAIVSLVFALGAVLTSVQADSSPFPAPAGPYKIGTAIRDWIDNARDELFTDGPAGKREILVQFWYPADAPTGGTLAPYMTASDKTLTAFESVVNGSRGIALTLPRDKFAAFQSHATINAPLAAAQPIYPVLIFSPGFGATPSMYTVQLEALASNGYIVVALNHPYGSSATAFPDRRVVTMNLNFNASANFPVWVADQAFVIDKLEQVNTNDPDKVFTNRLDLKHLGAFGHSLGAGAVIKLCSVDSRIQACLSEDSPALGNRIDKPLMQPLLMMESEAAIGTNDSVYQQAQGTAFNLVLNGFGHDSFSDFSLWPGIEPLAQDGALGSITPARSYQVLNTYVLAFFDKYLKNQPITLLDGASSDYPEVQFQARNK